MLLASHAVGTGSEWRGKLSDVRREPVSDMVREAMQLLLCKITVS